MSYRNIYLSNQKGSTKFIQNVVGRTSTTISHFRPHLLSSSRPLPPSGEKLSDYVTSDIPLVASAAKLSFIYKCNNKKGATLSAQDIRELL